MLQPYKVPLSKALLSNAKKIRPFEAKRGYFKGALNNCKNRKNICHTLAKKHQLYMYLTYSKKIIEKRTEPTGVDVT